MRSLWWSSRSGGKVRVSAPVGRKCDVGFLPSESLGFRCGTLCCGYHHERPLLNDIHGTESFRDNATPSTSHRRATHARIQFHYPADVRCGTGDHPDAARR